MRDSNFLSYLLPYCFYYNRLLIGHSAESIMCKIRYSLSTIKGSVRRKLQKE